jgi:hemerythrin-like domain-containing protein
MHERSDSSINIDRRRALKLAGATFLAAGLSPLLVRAAGTAAKTPGHVLIREHGVILLVQNAARQEVKKIRDTGEIDRERVLKMIEFFQEFGDRCHHGKEEDMYFPAAVERDGEKTEEVISRMEKEHVIFRGLLTSAEAAARGKKSGELAEALEVYTEMLFTHIRIENTELFKPIEFDPSVRKDLMQRFMRFENQELGEGFHERYKNLAERLAAG